RSTELLEVRRANKAIILSLPFKGREIKLPSGILTGQNASMKLRSLTWPYQTVSDLSKLPIPFACVATNLRTGEATSIKGVPLPDAIRASLSLPTVFSPVEIDGELYIDGGLSRNLPTVDAIDLGAEFLIGIDVGAPVDSVSALDPSFIDVILSTTLFHADRADIEQRELLDILIVPDINDLSRASFEQSREWIRRGEEATRALMPTIRSALDSLGIKRVGSYREGFEFKADSVRVTRIEITGTTDQSAIDIILNRLNFTLPDFIGPVEIEKAIARVYGTALFDQVSYSVNVRPRGPLRESILTVHVEPLRVPDRLGFGIRYDSFYKAEFLFNVALKNRRRIGSATEVRLRLGEQLEVDASHFSRLGPRSRFSIGSNLGYSSAPMNVFTPGKYNETLGTERDVPVNSLRIETYRARTFSGFASSEAILSGFFVKAAHVRIRQVVAGPVPIASDSLSNPSIGRLSDSQQEYGAAGLMWNMDTVDRVDFPTRGVRLRAEGEVGLSNSVPEISLTTQPTRDRFDLGLYRHAVVDAEWYAPVKDNVSFFGRATAVYGSGKTLPYSHYAFVGGVSSVTVQTGIYLPAYGLAGQQRFGRKAYLATIGLQIEPGRDLILRVAGQVGDTFDLFGDDDKKQLGPVLYGLVRDTAFFGFGVEFGVRTRLGPLKLILAGSDESERPNLAVRFGYDF
ncbi:MAG: hypothetical protein HKN13_00585, partial [Rhodothermales bacterium]|nr:hypothetical protein [Rhodothermales bacterium]